MNKLLFVLSCAVTLGGCVSIATHEEQMRRCRAAAARNEELTAKLDALEKEKSSLKGTLDKKDAEVAEVRTTYDELVSSLKEEVAKGDVAVGNSHGNLTITLGDKVLFPSGQWEVQARGKKVLAQVADILRDSESDKIVQVEGHTDNVKIAGSLKARFPSNWDLSAARASAVVRELQAAGVGGDRLVACAYGDTRPVTSNATPHGRRLNRRVEISLVPKS